ncbi:thiopurine S-methyltransferase [Thiomicrospira sp. WB1]|uniref:thiopurine S-methyltransferase n=1 Tax=Thiomicrospira sp. WB1 TaxID=1685380 RepID=UPI0007486571|nr:thiopurine S-methyltransferase [Thiomicrospira sp. WB1]KUJ71751.1 thiopurine S-methyltransferase [Thiomicrospira sp. WB1]
MQADFWHQMWHSGRVGFHQTEINRFLQSHWQALGLSGDESVLVPLCGKTLDMLWLKELGHAVTGVELSAKALEEFLQAHQLVGTPTSHPQLTGYEVSGLSLYCGDFFHLRAEDCAEIGAVYDRAALIALPEAMRREYVAHLNAILPRPVPQMLIAMTYDQRVLSGPPFSVDQSEIERLYGAHYRVQVLESVAFERKGVPTVETAYHLIPLE